MGLISLAAGVLLAVCVSASWQDKPSFCKGLDCPKYTVVDSNDRYELRNYEQSYWVTTNMAVTNYWQSRNSNTQAFWQLFSYISGENVQGLKMPMTTPVLTYHTRETAAMGFMIPHNLAGNAPAPTGQGVSLLTAGPRMVYVKNFTGDRWNRNYAAKVRELRNDLNADGITITDDTFYHAGYDGPNVRAGNRYHEIWIGKP